MKENIEENIEILKGLEEEYDYAFGAKIYKPHSLSIKEIKAIKHVLSDYISKQKVKDKIEELEKELKEYKEREFCLFEDTINEKIKIYKDLLEEE